MLQIEKLTRRQENCPYEVCPNIIPRSCNEKQTKHKRGSQNLGQPSGGGPLVLRYLSQFLDQKMIKDFETELKEILFQ